MKESPESQIQSQILESTESHIQHQTRSEFVETSNDMTGLGQKSTPSEVKESTSPEMKELIAPESPKSEILELTKSQIQHQTESTCNSMTDGGQESTPSEVKESISTEVNESTALPESQILELTKSRIEHKTESTCNDAAEKQKITEQCVGAVALPKITKLEEALKLLHEFHTISRDVAEKEKITEQCVGAVALSKITQLEEALNLLQDELHTISRDVAESKKSQTVIADVSSRIVEIEKNLNQLQRASSEVTPEEIKNALSARDRQIGRTWQEFLNLRDRFDAHKNAFDEYKMSHDTHSQTLTPITSTTTTTVADWFSRTKDDMDRFISASATIFLAVAAFKAKIESANFGLNMGIFLGALFAFFLFSLFRRR